MLNFGWSSDKKKVERKRKLQSLCWGGQGDAMKAAIKSQKQSIIESLETICDCVESRIFISISKWKWTKEEKLSPFVVPARSIVDAMNGINTAEWEAIIVKNSNHPTSSEMETSRREKEGILMVDL